MSFIKLTIIISCFLMMGMSHGAVAAGEAMFYTPMASENLSPPVLTVQTSELTVSLSWTSVDGAKGYILYYAPYPYKGPQTIGTIETGEKRSLTAGLWDGATFYVAVGAYNDAQASGYSNICYFSLKSAPPQSPVPDTGQAHCSDGVHEIVCPGPGKAFYGQDACYAINPMSYAKMDASGNSLPNEAVVWSMVRDNVTGLTWEVKTDDGSIHDRDNAYDWTESQNVFVETLNSMGFGGYTDWRVPTVQELSGILHYGTCDPVMNSGFFPNSQNSRYWTSTVNAGNPDQAWAVDVGSGYDSHFNAKTEHFAVRAVRGEKSSDSLVDNGDGTVNDAVTGLVWEKQTAPGTFSWREALEYCESLELGGKGDWRLPTIKELRSLVRYNAFEPSVNTAVFPDTVAYYYWSSTNNLACGGGVWYIHFSYGYSSDFYNESGRYHVRAVRGPVK